jgi:hypothetical protein
MPIKSMTLYWVGADPSNPTPLARYTLNGKAAVELEVLEEDSRTLAEAPMDDGVMLYDGEGGSERVYPYEPEKFFQALIQQGSQLSYYDYRVDR